MAEAIQLIKQFIVLIIFLDCVLQTMTTSAAQFSHHFMVEEDSFERLCISKNILTVNKQFPGPTIYAQGGETVAVDVENKGKNNMTISCQWWKRDVHEIVSEYTASDGKLPNSDAFPINGQPGDLYPCSNNETFKIEVEPGNSYLLRLINAAVGKTLVFGIANHKLTKVGINGWHTKPMSSMVDYVGIKTQHSIDCILEANQKPDHYYMAAREYSSYINMEYDHNTTTTAIVKYKGKYVPSSPTSLPYLPSTYSGEPTISHTRTNTCLIFMY
ncbi:laccase-14-like [Lycium ferocissimum]|uniref:laccase-14-like n=1 Tax=Lycium ferocissimum TaxID=112874 RepID=UPI0028161801|nr:laccase-14-like [Lycium ferocissimum]